MFGIILAVTVFAWLTALVLTYLLQIIQPVQKAVVVLAQTQNTLDADHGLLTAWAATGKLGQAVLAAQKATQQTVSQWSGDSTKFVHTHMAPAIVFQTLWKDLQDVHLVVWTGGIFPTFAATVHQEPWASKLVADVNYVKVLHLDNVQTILAKVQELAVFHHTIAVHVILAT